MEITLRQTTRSHAQRVIGLVVASSDPALIPLGAQVEFDEVGDDTRSAPRRLLRHEGAAYLLQGDPEYDMQPDGTYVTVRTLDVKA